MNVAFGWDPIFRFLCLVRIQAIKMKTFSATYWSWISIGGEGQTLFNAQWAEPCSHLDPKGHKIYFYERWPLFPIERCSMETGPSAHRVHTDQHIPHTLVLSCTQRMIYRNWQTCTSLECGTKLEHWRNPTGSQGKRTNSVQTAPVSTAAPLCHPGLLGGDVLGLKTLDPGG